jgi:hypothetical protein
MNRFIYVPILKKFLTFNVVQNWKKWSPHVHINQNYEMKSLFKTLQKQQTGVLKLAV